MCVSSGESLDEAPLKWGSTAMGSTAIPRLVFSNKLDGVHFQYSPNVKHGQGESSLTIAAGERLHDTISNEKAHYIFDTC